MATVARWLLRLFALLALLLFATLAVVFGVITVDRFGTKEYVTDSVGGLPPVYIITALLVLPCLAFVAGFWLLFLDTFRQERVEPRAETLFGSATPLRRSLLERMRLRRRLP
jgi:TRAP-type C4-dicarboxylate transport system permease small subunit